MKDNKYMTGRLISLFLYTLLIVYGSLYPFTGWQLPDGNIRSSLVPKWPHHISLADSITNFLVYMPLGLLTIRFLFIYSSSLQRIFIATILGTIVSFILEWLQLFLPGRTASLSDVFLNASGTFAGAAFAEIFSKKTLIGSKLMAIRQHVFLPGRMADFGIIILILWALSQLLPLVPSLDLGNLKYGLKPLWNTLHDLHSFDLYQALVYAFSICGLGLIASFVLKDKKNTTIIFAFFATIVFLCKVPIVGRQLSMEALAGLFIGLLLLILARCLTEPVLVVIAASAILSAFIIDELRPPSVPLSSLHPFNWIPFRHNMTNIMGLVSITEMLWKYASLSYLMILLRSQRAFAFVILAGFLLIILVFALEWIQQGIPGRFPDITAVMLAVIGWVAPWLYVDVRNVQHVRNVLGETNKRFQ
jgi:VanZ family protein